MAFELCSCFQSGGFLQFLFIEMYQGGCGSCWAFSTTGAVEGAHFLNSGKLVSLSEQQLVDCDHQCDREEADACDAGCNGGFMTNAYQYVEAAGGLELESDYPYEGRDGKCKFDSNKVAVKVSNFTNIPVDEDQVAAYLIKSGPLASKLLYTSPLPFFPVCFYLFIYLFISLKKFVCHLYYFSLGLRYSDVCPT